MGRGGKERKSEGEKGHDAKNEFMLF